MNSTDKKTILVIGATGAQGLAVIEKLLAPGKNGSPSPYAVRALTRDPQSRRAKALAAKGVEFVQGRFDDFGTVAAALKGAYGAWVNIDGFTVGEEREVKIGQKIFELARDAGVQHYVWSSLDYASKITNFDPTYKCDHYDAKGRVAEWMQTQPSVPHDKNMSWTIVTSGPYMDMLFNAMFGPLKRRKDGTVVFVTPVGKGHVPMIALSDLGYFARYTFDHREETSGADLQIASELVDWEYLKTTFEKVTGQKAEVIYQSIDEWMNNWVNVERPVAYEDKVGEGTTTWRKNFSAWWALWRDDIVKRDMAWIRKVNPHTRTLESWMKSQNYGDELFQRRNLLKIHEDRNATTPDWERVDQL